MAPNDADSRLRAVVALVVSMIIGSMPISHAFASSPERGGHPPPVLTLRECVRLALESSAALRIREAEIRIADQNVTEAWGAFLPNVSLSGSYNRSDRTDFDIQHPIYGAGLRGFETVAGDSVYIPYEAVVGRATRDVAVKATSKSWGLAANLNLFDGMANVNRLGAAKARYRATEFGEQYTREMVIQNVAVAYYELLRFQRLREVANEARDQAMAELQRTETYFRLGSIAKSDVLQQKVRLGQTNYDLVVAQNRVRKATADLAYAMNQPIAGSLAVDTSPLTTAMALDEDIDRLYEQALMSRLDLQGSEQESRAADRAAAAASGAFLPRLDVYTRYSRSYDESPYRFGAQESQSWLWGAQVSWDVFNRFQNFTGRAKARAQARIAAYQYDQAQLDAQLEIRQYHNAMREAIEKHRVSVETITHAEEELRLAQERFRVGAGTQLDRITAEVNLARARADEVQAICDYLIAQARLWRATGRLSSLEFELP